MISVLISATRSEMPMVIGLTAASHVLSMDAGRAGVGEGASPRLILRWYKRAGLRIAELLAVTVRCHTGAASTGSIRVGTYMVLDSGHDP